MDEVLARLAADTARVVSAQLQRRVAPGPNDADKSVTPVPAKTIFVDGDTFAFLPPGTHVEFPNRTCITREHQVTVQCEKQVQGQCFHIKAMLDNYGNIYVTFETATALPQPSSGPYVPPRVQEVCSVYLVRGYAAYPRAVHHLFSAALMVGPGQSATFQLISATNNINIATNFAGLNEDARAWIIAGLKNISANYCTYWLKRFEDPWRLEGLPVPVPAPDACTDAVDEAAAAFAQVQAAERANVRNEILACENVICTLRGQVMEMAAERAAQSDAAAAAAARELELNGSIYTLQRENKALEMKLLEATQNTSLAVSAAVAAATRAADKALNDLRERVGTLDHSEIQRLNLQLETEALRATESEKRATALQAEVVRVCKRNVAADAEVAQAKGAIRQANDAAADLQRQVSVLTKDLAAVRKQMETLTAADNGSAMVAILNDQLRECAAREQALQETVQTKTRACEQLRKQLNSISALCMK
jgi:hypothetical protein